MENQVQAEIHALQYQTHVLEDLIQTQTPPVAQASGSGSRLPSDVIKINQELDHIGVLANNVAHQYGIISLIGLPSVSRDVALMAKLASSACAKAVTACFGNNTKEACAAQEDYTTLALTYQRLSARFHSALREPDYPIETLMAGWAIIASIAKIGHHAARLATMSA